MKGHGTKIIKLVSTSGKNTVEQASEGRIGKICYVDDSRTSAYVTKKILKEYGYEVDFFPSAEPAVVAILENDYDLLLTDLTLSTGGMDGDELVRFLRNSGHPRKKLLPVIVITGTSNKETLLKIYEAGANGVLVKPLTGEELHDRIRTLVPEKAFPGSADGYALEIPQTLSHPGKPQKEISAERSKEAAGQMEADITDKADSLLSTLGIPTNRKKAEPATSKKPARNKKNKTGKQKTSKLSILENLKSASNEDPALDLDAGIDDVIISNKKTKSANVSRQHKKPAYKSTTHKNTKPAGKSRKTKSSGAEFIAELRAQAKADIGSDIVSEKPGKTGKQKANISHDDIPVLEPANGEGLLFGNDEIPELKLLEPETKAPSPESKLAGADKIEASPAFNFDTEEAIGDKKIITALDINTEFADFEEEDIYSPSLSNTILDTFRSYKILSLATLVSFGIIIWSLWNYFNVDKIHLVETVPVTKGTLHQTINVPGKVSSKLNIDIKSSTSGQIVAVLVKEGQKVKKGKILVKLENEEAISDVKRAEGNLLSSREETALASKTLKRMKRALKLGAISRQQMEEAEASYKSARAKEDVSRESSRIAKMSLEKLNVAAPFSGTITTKFAQVGQWLTPADILFTLVDLNLREIEVKVDTADSNSISVGQSAFMSSDASPDKSWTESVTRIASAASKGTGTNTISVYLSLGPKAPSLRMGQQVDAEIRTRSRNNTNKLPISAVISRNGKSWVGTINEGRIHYVPIETGMEDLTHVEILRGLNTNQQVIIPNGQDLQEGDRVRMSSTLTRE